MQAVVFSMKPETKGDWAFEKGGFKIVFVGSIIGLQNSVEDPTVW